MVAHTIQKLKTLWKYKWKKWKHRNRRRRNWKQRDEENEAELTEDDSDTTASREESEKDFEDAELNDEEQTMQNVLNASTLYVGTLDESESEVTESRSLRMRESTIDYRDNRPYQKKSSWGSEMNIQGVGRMWYP